MTNIAVIYYSSTGSVHALAEAVAEGAREAGADVRLRRVPELAPEEVIRGQNAWHEHHEATKHSVPEATNEDLEWADGVALGTPTRFGLPSSQLKQFIDQTGPLWAAGKLSNKTATSFTSTQNVHGGSEATLLSLNNVFYHWGAIIVPPGNTEAVTFAAGGNPYGVSYPSGDGTVMMPEAVKAAARHQGNRLARFTSRLLQDTESVSPIELERVH